MKHEWKRVTIRDGRDEVVNRILAPLEGDGWEAVAFQMEGSDLRVLLRRPTAETAAKMREASQRSYPPGQAGVLVELNPQVQ